MDDAGILRRVIALSRTGIEGRHGGPFGCVITKSAQIVSEAHNEVASSKDPTAHAETLAIRRASALLQSFDLSDCELYTNGAPCCMCAAAMLWAKVRRCHYILPMAASEAVGLGDLPFYGELARPLDRRVIVPMVCHPELSAEAMAVYQDWYRSPRRIAF